jgi:hypothetical protein
MWQELVNNFWQELPAFIAVTKVVGVILFLLFTAGIIEHYFKPKSALEEKLEQIELEEKVGVFEISESGTTDYITTRNETYRAEQWK